MAASQSTTSQENWAAPPGREVATQLQSVGWWCWALGPAGLWLMDGLQAAGHLISAERGLLLLAAWERESREVRV